MAVIAALYNHSGPRADTEALKRMLRVLEHRGSETPRLLRRDNLALGMRCSELEKDCDIACDGTVIEDSKLFLLFDGRLSNGQELASDLEIKAWKLRSTADSELVLSLYRQAGEAMPSLLNGKFACIVWDSEKSRLIAAVDRMGQKSLYYAYIGKQLLVASEIKALLETGLPRELDERSLLDFFTVGFVLENRTFFKGIRRLLPGQVMVANKDGMRVLNYWKPDFIDYRKYSEEEVTHRLSHFLKESIRRALQGAAPIAGYFDPSASSAAMAYLVSQFLGGGFRTYSASWYWDYAPEEKKYIESVASLMGARNTHVLLKTERLHESIDRLMWFMEEPALARDAFVLYHLAEHAARGTHTLVGSLGAAEIIEGAGVFAMETAASLGGSLADRAQPVSWKENKLFVSLLAPELLKTLGEYEPQAALDEYLSSVAGVPERRGLMAEICIGLPAMLAAWDKIATPFSLEGRHPLMDNHIVDLVLSLRSGEDEKNPRTRRELFYSVLRQMLPGEIFTREKVEPVPNPLAVSKGRQTRDVVKKVLLDLKCRQRGIFSAQKLRLFLQKRDLDAKSTELLWKILCLEIWAKRYFDRLFLSHS